MKILVATDGSASSDAAVEEVCTRPWPPDSEVRLVTATVGLPAADPLAREGVYDEWVKSQRTRAAALLAATGDRIRRQAGGLSVSTALLEGSPKEAILDEAERWAADLIVVGSQGAGALKRFLLGSVSHAVALYAPCSVAIIRRRT